VIGADGIHSKVRQCLFDADRPEFTGCVAWRGLVPMEKLPPHLAQLQGTNWLGPHGHVLHYPVRRGEIMNFISMVERDDWQIESWVTQGTKDELANDFRGWHADVHAIIDRIETPYKWALYVRGPMPRWSKGRVTLLGDACHPTLPFLGQGGVMAIEDGYIIAACLAKHFDDPRPPLRATRKFGASAPPRWWERRTRTAARCSAPHSPKAATPWRSRWRASGSRSACVSAWNGSTPTTRPQWPCSHRRSY
jgi:salicylate hydroxylase